MTEPKSTGSSDPPAGPPAGPAGDALTSAPKRRGLTLPPRGQALTRLQDLERDEPIPSSAPTPPATESSNAVSTAISNAVPGNSPAEAPFPSIIERAPPVREPTTRITVDMPNSLHRRVSILSAETRRSIKDLVLDALQAQYFQAPATDRAPD